MKFFKHLAEIFSGKTTDTNPAAAQPAQPAQCAPATADGCESAQVPAPAADPEPAPAQPPMPSEPQGPDLLDYYKDWPTGGKPLIIEPGFFVDRYQNYFRIGREVGSYGGTDRVVGFKRQGQIGWEVQVVDVRDRQVPPRVREHCTAPGTYGNQTEETLAEWEKTHPLPPELRRPRIYLNVKYSDKDAAKAKGARWHPQTKCWIVPPDADPLEFLVWMDNPLRQAVLAHHRARQECIGRLSNESASPGSPQPPQKPKP